MMRRVITTLTAALLLTIGITACGSSAGAATAQDNTEAQTTQTDWQSIIQGELPCRTIYPPGLIKTESRDDICA